MQAGLDVQTSAVHRSAAVPGRRNANDTPAASPVRQRQYKDSKMEQKEKEQKQDVPDIRIAFELYKLYVDSMEKVAQRRQTSNNFFLTLNSSLLLGSSIANSVSNFKLTTNILLTSIGIVLCIIWIQLNKNYNLLNRVKFNIIHRMETLFLIMPFTDEWAELSSLKGRKRYKSFSLLENFIPVSFIILYLLTLIAIIFIRQ